MMPSETVAKMRHLSFQSELRQEFVYSNTVYLVLAHIVATVSHMSYPEFLKKNVFDPLGMDSATQDSFEAKRSGKRTDGFIRSGLDRRVGGSLGVARSMGWWTDTDGVWHQGAGGIAMNTKDSVRYPYPCPSFIQVADFDGLRGQMGERVASSRKSSLDPTHFTA